MCTYIHIILILKNIHLFIYLSKIYVHIRTVIHTYGKHTYIYIYHITGFDVLRFGQTDRHTCPCY